MAAKKEPQRKPEDKYPIEAEAHSYRRPKRPTPKSIQRKDGAVILLTWMPGKFGENWDDIADRDFEPTSTTVTHDIGGKQMTEAAIYFQVQDDWAKEDVETHKGAEDEELRFASIIVDNTDPDNLHFKTVSMRGGSVKWRADVRAKLEANPLIIFSKSIRERVAEQGDVNAKAAKKRQKVGNQPKAVKRVRKQRAAEPASANQDRVRPRARKRVKKEN